MNFTSIHPGIKTLLTASALLIIQSCSSLLVQPTAPALNEESVTAVLSSFANQETAAKTLFFTGTLTLTGPDSEDSVQILMIADTPPPAGRGGCPRGRMKIELTHPWGKPLIHILVEGSQLDILNFPEKRFYRGTIISEYLSQRLPVPLNLKILWSIARAFPALLEHRSATSPAGNQINLMDGEGHRVQVFELYAGEPLPFKVSFCGENASMVFSHWQDDDGILFARRMTFRSGGQKIGLGIEIDQIRFNTPLPKAVFEMAAPQNFTTVRLKDGRREP